MVADFRNGITFLRFERITHETDLFFEASRRPIGQHRFWAVQTNTSWDLQANSRISVTAIRPNKTKHFSHFPLHTRVTLELT
jgi:hypothetical protein